MKVGAFEVLSELGRGGMGVVYRVRGPDGREAALKLFARTDAATLARFERERRLLASLGEAEGFVPLLDAGVSAETPWLVMPLAAGGTLRRKLAKGPLGVDETVALGLALATALGAAHERGIVHRDVKPENILFTADGRPLLADLGLAKHFDRLARGASQSVSLSREGVFKGTAGYMAPEQLEDAKSVGPPADVFALGAVLHECLVGRPAFAGEDLVEVLARVTSGTVERIGGVPPWLDAAIRRALSPAPQGRFADGGAFARALRERPAPARRILPLVLGAVSGTLLLAALALAPGRRAREAPPPTSPPAPEARALPPPTASTLTAPQLLDRGNGRALAGDLDGALADFAKAKELDPGNAVVWANDGAALLRREPPDLDAAIADLTKALELDPRLAPAWANRAYVRFQKEDVEGALADSSRAIELDPGIAIAWTAHGSALSRKGDRDQAIADLTRSIALDPAPPTAWGSRATLLYNKGDMDGALADSSEAIARAPLFVSAWATRGHALAKKGDLDGAIAALTRTLELDPRQPSALATRADALGNKGDFEAAIADYTSALELEPGAVDDWHNRAIMRFKKGDNDGAIADLTRALELEPALVAAWRSRGLVRAAMNENDAAIADFSRAIELAPGDARTWRLRGQAHMMKGEREQAIADLTHALELDPSGSEAPNIRALLADARKRAP